VNEAQRVTGVSVSTPFLLPPSTRFLHQSPIVTGMDSKDYVADSEDEDMLTSMSVLDASTTGMLPSNST
jgi:hypothetical protein